MRRHSILVSGNVGGALLDEAADLLVFVEPLLVEL
jgi:hypothetical protein